jgi:hypothetical protein
VGEPEYRIRKKRSDSALRHPCALRRLMAAMTAAFAIGQLIGPLAVRAAGSAADAIRMPSLLAATLLFISALLLVQRSGKNPANEIGPANRAK